MRAVSDVFLDRVDGLLELHDGAVADRHDGRGPGAEHGAVRGVDQGEIHRLVALDLGVRQRDHREGLGRLAGRQRQGAVACRDREVARDEVEVRPTRRRAARDLEVHRHRGRGCAGALDHQGGRGALRDPLRRAGGPELDGRRRRRSHGIGLEQRKEPNGGDLGIEDVRSADTVLGGIHGTAQLEGPDLGDDGAAHQAGRADLQPIVFVVAQVDDLVPLAARAP